jgi:outer membrane protein TolC
MMPRAMRLVSVLAAVLVTTPAVARADLVTRALAAGAGGAPPPSAAADDLLAWAGEARAITLPELLQLATRQAPALASARIDIAVAEAQISETWVRHDWLVRAQATGNRTLGAFAGIAVQSQAYGMTGDLSRALPTGGTFDLHVGSQYTSSDSSFGNSTLWQDSISGSITQPIFKGRGQALYDATERKAELSRDAVVLARRIAAIQTVEAVIAAYWDLVLAERQVAIT